MLKNSEFIKSPLNYTGGKYKLLKDIIPLIPEGREVFVDLFAGGFNVGINASAKKIICNDQNRFIVEMFSFFKMEDSEKIISEIKKRINHFSLSLTNKEGYLELRKEYNKTKSPLDLFTLTCYAFNHQIRFNNRHEFNTPFGYARSQYNESIEYNLIKFCRRLKEMNIEFFSLDFEKFDISSLTTNDFVYLDPPYLISNAVYNDGKRGFKNWSIEQEKTLIALMLELNRKEVPFMLSNVLEHKGEQNEILLNFSRDFRIIRLDKTYENCNYHKKHQAIRTSEVLILNY